MILSAAEVLFASTTTSIGATISATFHDIRHFETLSNVQFLDCTFAKGTRIACSTFENCNFENCVFRCDFFACKFVNCGFINCRFWQNTLNGIVLDNTEIVESEFRYCFLNAVTGGVIADCGFNFCELQEFETGLENCRIYHVTINEPDTDNN